ncbi:MAG: hypothetical protein BGO31_11055 [Bacteroidetes bacterium 43-16]|uniref:RagB/SusD family nutrient uptake outer membrane protein n=1 Tax=uncultured Dysgonomonas sp. TaxID=206096 RepID=UPI000927BB6B|nr:RagB/SusD family nutrient uptake outer membrane protein [uncultured Dysgonomonas sp.]OJV50997.1 MAG: hypothetical protein BGO31_11055 [Bacteroidetes bacterium 43-16]
MKSTILYLLTLIAFSGCHKAFLEEPTSKSLVIPKTYQDLNALLQSNMNSGAFFSMIADGDFDLTDEYLLLTAPVEKTTYLWKADIYETLKFHGAWRLPYLQILNTNVVLEGLKKLNTLDASQQNLNTLKGNALFFRAMAYTELVLNFTPPYKPSEAQDQLGLPIRTSSNVSEIKQRSNLKETMEFLLKDLQEASSLLPEKVSIISLPGKAAAYTLLSRTYLGMQEYDKSLTFAKEALKIQSDLLDYNDIPLQLPFTFNDPFVSSNKEVLFYQGGETIMFVGKSAQLREEIYDSYQLNDLRKTRLFDNNRNFIGNYSGTNAIFSGITNSEAWLTAAECAARLGKMEEALNYLNSLCKKRYDKTFTPYQSVNKKEILKWILEERRKELITRSRWFDLRRLNLDPEFAVTLTRKYKGDIYTLPPNSSRYTFPIPSEEIDYSGITQNVRNDND